MGLTVEYDSTPALWLCYNEEQCFCEDCRYRVVMGTGKTREQAIEDYRQKLADHEDKA